MKPVDSLDAHVSLFHFLQGMVDFNEQSYSIHNCSNDCNRHGTKTIYPNVKKQLGIMVDSLNSELQQLLGKLKLNPKVWNIELLREKYREQFDGELEFHLFALRVLISYVNYQIQIMESQADTTLK